jgi:kumamolisin
MTSRKVFQDSIVPLPAQTGITPSGLMIQASGSGHLDEALPVHFSFDMPADNQEALEKRVSRGETLTPDELSQQYGPQKLQLNKLVSWLRDQGFDITHVAPDGVYATATADQVSKSLDVNMVRVTKDGITYTAAQNAPSLPADIAGGVGSINGLQPFLQVKKHFRLIRPGQIRHRITRTQGSGMPSTAIQNAPPYLAAEFLKAYNADSAGVTGKGQTIAILIDTFPLQEDLIKFWADNHLDITPAQVAMINVKGGGLPAIEGEETLDAQWASAMAPGANIRIYASGSLQFTDLDRALDKIIEDASAIQGLNQLSISLGLGETYMAQGEVTTQHQKFLKLAALGVNVFVSSGDAGSNPDQYGQHGGPLQAEHPSSDPFVIGVGGTSLQLSATGSVMSENAWVGSGGGQSIYFARPSWQNGPGVPAGVKRLVPDVGLAADPNYGAYVVLHGAVHQIGGTSWSAPAWAGFCALINEARINSGKPRLSFLNPLLYPLTGGAGFRDIQQGTNGTYQAGAGYDMITGIGVPNLKALIALLTA